MDSFRANLVNHLFLKIRIDSLGDAVTQSVIRLYVILCVMLMPCFSFTVVLLGSYIGTNCPQVAMLTASGKMRKPGSTRVSKD